MRKLLTRWAVATAALGALAVAGTAQAGNVAWSLGISTPGVAVGVAPPVAYGPPPVAYAPAPVYYTPPNPYYYAPPRPVYYPPPVAVYYRPPAYVPPPRPVYYAPGYRPGPYYWR